MKLPPAGPVYGLADLDALGPSDLPAAAAEMVEAGIRWVQLRAKSASGAGLYRLLERLSRQLEGADCTLWLDDRVDLAALFGTAVHVGQRDLPAAAAARVLAAVAGPGAAARAAIGVSTHTRDQFDAALADPNVDAIAVGPVFATRSKAAADPVVGLDLVRYARQRLDAEASPRPLIAIGGIGVENLAEVLDAGADTAAVLSAVCGAATDPFVPGQVGARCRRLLSAV